MLVDHCLVYPFQSVMSIVSELGRLQWKLKGVLNLNFRPFSFELNKNRFFKMNFELGFRDLRLQKPKIFKLLFPLS